MYYQRRKIPKTLSGIETEDQGAIVTIPVLSAGKYLKPYQGLKRWDVPSQLGRYFTPENTYFPI